ncbi:nicotinamide-nucleotide amidase [Maritalea mobilis]|uniref:Nicotinamide-nucleotide amidase n=1 Tax=Maritalea mobilis TaxID=483324 RepID=A0A4R6VUD0_9HYPH|nr:CinA family protein [Maritalea mobilis]TDQ66327.1 nicotinamide-nucleotide amidase [Maritalea mobilis]
MLEDDVLHLAQITIEQLISKQATIATAESCTGGLIAGALTSVPGSSAAVFGGYVTYSNEAKTQMLGVPVHLIEEVGAVSKEVACAMAEGAQRISGATLSVAVTGIAGPGGGTAEKPVGLVHFACADEDGSCHIVRNFKEMERDEVREETVRVALTLVLARLDQRQLP